MQANRIASHTKPRLAFDKRREDVELIALSEARILVELFRGTKSNRYTRTHNREKEIIDLAGRSYQRAYTQSTEEASSMHGVAELTALPQKRQTR